MAQTNYGKVIQTYVENIKENQYTEFSNILPTIMRYLNYVTTADIKYIEKISNKIINKEDYKIQNNDETIQELKMMNLENLLKGIEDLSEYDKALVIGGFKYFEKIQYDNVVETIFRYFWDYKIIFDLFDEFKVPEEDYGEYAKSICDEFKFTINDETLLFKDYKKGKTYEKHIGPAHLILTRESYRNLKIEYRIPVGDLYASSYHHAIDGTDKIYGYSTIIDKKNSDSDYVQNSIKYGLKKAKEFVDLAIDNLNKAIQTQINIDECRKKYENEKNNYELFIQYIKEVRLNNNLFIK